MDVRFAIRTLARNKTFTAIAVLTLAVGIGANTAIFSVVNGVLLRPLPYDSPERLFVLQENIPSLSRIAPVLPVSGNHFTAWRRDCRSCEAMSALRPMTFNLTGEGAPERVSAARVSANLFNVLGIQPQLGRWFTEQEDQPGNDRVVMLSDTFWRRRFMADASIAGKTIRLNGNPFTIVGVLPASFVPPKGYELNALVGFDQRTDMWTPVAFSPEDLRSPLGNFNYSAIVRAKPQVTAQQITDELNSITAGIVNSIPNEKDRAEVRVFVLPMQNQIVGNARQSLLLLMASVGALLLIVCANLANLLLARGSARQRELAVRTALGANRTRLLRQLLVENLIIALIGGALGLIVVAAALRILRAYAPHDLPRVESISIDAWVLMFTMLLSGVASIVFGWIPAWRGARSDPQGGLRGGRGLSESHAGGRLRTVFVAAEVALSVTLLVAAGLLLSSFANALRVDKGFNEAGTLAADLTLPPGKYQQAMSRIAFFDAVLERVKNVPGVETVGLTNVLPLSGHGEVNPIIPEGSDPAIKDSAVTDTRYVNRDYFRAMSIPLQRGEVFQESDRPRKIALVSARTAERVWPGENPIGKRFRYNSRTGPFSEVIGVVGDVQNTSLQETAADQTLMVYIPYWERTPTTASVVVRASVPPGAIAQPIRRAIWQVDPDLPVPEFRTMQQVVSATVESERFRLILVVAFSSTAIALAALGVYGVVAYSVSQRRNEIGIRIALGADGVQVRHMVLRQGLKPVVVGLALGIAGALATGRLLGGLLFGVSSHDSRVYAIVSGIVIIAALCACYPPARSASRANPATVLREG